MKGILKWDLFLIRSHFIWVQLIPLVLIAVGAAFMGNPGFSRISIVWTVMPAAIIRELDSDMTFQLTFPWKRWQLVLSRFVWLLVPSLLYALIYTAIGALLNGEDVAQYGMLCVSTSLLWGSVLLLASYLRAKQGGKISASVFLLGTLVLIIVVLFSDNLWVMEHEVLLRNAHICLILSVCVMAASLGGSIRAAYQLDL